MSARSIALVTVIALFGVLTALALEDVGYLGLVAPLFRSRGGGQVLADLAIMCALGIFWIVGDARARGTNPWPYVALTLVGGSFGVLFYLVARELRAAARAPAALQPR